MASHRRGWVLLVSLLFTQLFMFGPTAGTIGVFIPSLVRTFGWSREAVSSIAVAYSVMLGIGCLISGGLLEAIDARWVMSVGAVVAGVGMFCAASIHSLGGLFASYVLVGAGVALGGVTPATVVAANWYPHRRGTAVAITLLGLSLGMAAAPPLVMHVIVTHGWRMGMIALGLPMVLLSAPAAFIMVRTRPAEAPAGAMVSAHGHVGATGDHGVELGVGMLTSAFWLLLGLCLFSQLGVGSILYHMVPYLMLIGYSPEQASMIMGAQALLVSVGSVGFGILADYFGPRPVLLTTFVLLAASVMMLIGASDPHWAMWAVTGFIIVWGVNMGNMSALAPLVANSLGMRRFSTFMGIVTMFWFFGEGFGPLIAGGLFDRTHTYTVPFELAAAFFLLSAVLTAMVYPARGVASQGNREEMVA
ncbi:MAG TPA: MFS transporter [Candidatus Binataceae bacterium]|nr:MFS transporter [Candidatus Binataceae bacterium]